MSRQTNPRPAPALKPSTQTALFLNGATARKPFCKVCKDAGKPESDYTSHYVRSLPDRQGNTKVTCPTLLNTECRYCYGLGHTSKFCPVLAARKKDDERRERDEKRRATEQKSTQKPKVDLRGGGFRALMDSDDEAEPTPVVEEFPALGEPSQRVITGSYASAAAKPAPVVALEKQNPVLPTGFQVLQKGAVYEKTEPVKRILKFSWLDDDSDDSDNEAEPYVDNSAWD